MSHAGGSMYIHSSQQHHPLNQQIFKTSVDGLRTLPPHDTQVFSYYNTVQVSPLHPLPSIFKNEKLKFR